MAVLLSFIFLLSGAAGLLFETLWFRLAGLSLGGTVWTSSIVLAAFMCGLGLGNAAAAKYGSVIRRPLKLYGVFEFLVGGFGFAVVASLPHTNALLRPVLSALTETPWALHLVRLTVAFTLMLIPAAAMGTTLPLLTKALLGRDDNYGRVLGKLYGWNTMGGVAGALASELWLIPHLGLLGAGLSAAGLNGVAGLMALLIDARPSPLASHVQPPQNVGEAQPLARRAVRYLWVAGISGALLLALEVVWFRFLQLFVQGTVLGFAAMLATVLMGIAVGGLVAGRLLSLRMTAVAWLPAVACLAGASVAFLYAVFDPSLGGRNYFFNDVPATLWLSFRLMFPTALLSGVLFTFTGRALKDSCPDATRATGWLALANTIGATLGALLGGFVLLPGLGMERSLFLLALAYGALAAICWRRPTSRRQAYASYASLAALALVLGLFPFGLLRNHFLRITIAHYQCTGATLAVYHEGLNETVALLRFDWGHQPFAYRLITNGMSMSGTWLNARRYMKIPGFWAFAVKPDIERALMITYGVGNTGVALRAAPSLRAIDVVDISRDILDLGDTIYTPDNNPLRDRRFHVHVEDGRFFLQTTHERYDLITGEPPPPKLAGIGNLYTRQFFGLVRDRLNDGGVVTYYFPVHLLTSADARAVLRAFCDVFPNCSLWNGYGDDWMMAGVRGTLPRAEERQFVGAWERPPSASQLVDIGIETPEQLGALFIADAPTLRAWIGDAAPLEDNYPGRLSGLIPSAQGVRYLRSLADARAARGLFESSEFIRATWPETLRERSAPYFETQEALNNVWDVPEHDRFFSDLHRVLTSTRLRTVPLLLLGSEPRYHEIARLVQADNEGIPALDYQNGIGALAEREFERAAQLFAAARQGDPSLKRVGLYQVFALACANRAAEARAALMSLSPAERAQASAANLGWLTAFAGGSAAVPAVAPH